MSVTNSIINYRRHLKRRNYSAHTIKNYMNTLKQFVLWVNIPIEEMTHKKVLHYIDHLIDRGLKPKTINSHLDSIRGFYNFLLKEEELNIPHPVKRGYVIRQSKPLPRHLRDEEVSRFFKIITKARDRAMFMIMLRCGLRVEEVSMLTLNAIDLNRRRVYVHHGKGGKDRVVSMSNDAYHELVVYLRLRPPSRAKRLFLVEKGVYRGRPISVRGIQKRMEYYAEKANLKVSCHHLRHTMATQLLNADADLVTIQDLLGHSRIRTTERYCKVSNLKVERDYFKAMDVIMHRMGGDAQMT